MNRILSCILTLLLVGIFAFGAVAYAAGGEGLSQTMNNSETQQQSAETEEDLSKTQLENKDKYDNVASEVVGSSNITTATPNEPNNTTTPYESVITTPTLSETYTTEDVPAEDAVASESSLQNLSLDAPTGKKFGILIVEQSNGVWQINKAHYYDSYLLFIILCVVAAAIAVSLYMLGLLLVNKACNRKSRRKTRAGKYYSGW